MAKKKWAGDVDLKEGALRKIGWPSAAKIIANIRAGKVSRATAMRRLAFIANMGNATAKKVMGRIKSELGEAPSKKKK